MSPSQICVIKSTMWEGFRVYLWYLHFVSDLTQIVKHWGRNAYAISLRPGDLLFTSGVAFALHWRHHGRDSVSNHQPHDYFTQPFIQTQIKENITAPRHWPLCGESLAFVWGIHREPVNSRTNGQWRGKCFHLMTSSWVTMVTYCQHQHPLKHTRVNFISNIRTFSFRKKEIMCNHSLQHGCHFVQVSVWQLIEGEWRICVSKHGHHWFG